MKQLISALVLLLVLSPSSQAAKVAGVDIPDTLSAAGSELKLNGAGVRSKWFIDVYVGGLYLPQANKDASSIVKADEPMAIKLHMVSGMVTSEKMQKATTEGFENATNGNTAPIKANIDKFIGVFDEEIQENDEFDLVYLPGKGVEVYKNDALAATIDGGVAFKEALFGIWLSDKPAQEDLKKAMLGAK
ncbi:chalcone isomerase [Hahella sp. KA22]|uniref:chalcone isomerase family protein n=1 Tax=Hahella sp. KA22 TaxID=1628392 RepID=UPI000FDD6D42|nr:chalcone isomerase family protein [Hahella sp. KA22]AZZ93615.1 chalcone isomerase [Hahella sp. KA22]QAY56989.1 chalcone isomerase [Hahella sp. KA22]